MDCASFWSTIGCPDDPLRQSVLFSDGQLLESYYSRRNVDKNQMESKAVTHEGALSGQSAVDYMSIL